MLAVAVVLALGTTFGALFVIFIADSKQLGSMMIFGALSVALGLIWILSTEPSDPSDRAGSWWRRWFYRRRAKHRYRAKSKTRIKTKVIEFGTNAPPSVESVRRIKEERDGMRGWTPRSTSTSPEGPPDKQAQ